MVNKSHLIIAPVARFLAFVIDGSPELAHTGQSQHLFQDCAMTARHVPVLIIGSGPAGYTAAIYAARAMLKPVLIAGMEQGGQLMITTDVENYPGYADPVQGPWMMEQMLKQAEHVGAEIVNDLVTEVEITDRPFTVKTDSGAVWTCDALIIATGAQAKWLGIPTEKEFMGFGVSACATCDGFFYRGKNVIVVGGGNSAVEEALYLSNLAAKVTVSIAATNSAPKRSCSSACSTRTISTSSGTPKWSSIWARRPAADAGLGQRRQAEEPQDRRDHRHADRRCLRRHRPCPSRQPVQGQAQAQAERLFVDRTGFDCHGCARAFLPPATSPTISTARP
jgi:hypothetical protein